VVFSHPSSSPAALQADLEAVLADALGFEVPVVLRTRAELAEVVARNPYPGVEHTKLHVLFFSDELPAGELERIDVRKFAPETLVARAREIYLHLPDGMGRAKLPSALGRLALPATARNWRTVEKLLDLMSY